MKVRAAAATTAALAAFSGCGGIEQAGAPAAPPVVAIVGADEITGAELDAVIAESRRSWDAEGEEYPEPGSEKDLDLRRQAMELLIERSKLEQAATALGVSVSASAVDRELAARKHGSEELAAGRSDDQLRLEIRDDLLEFEAYRTLVAGIREEDYGELQRLRTEVWKRWTQSRETEYTPSWFAPGHDPAELPRNVRRNPRPENQRPPSECDLPDGSYDYGELVELGCAGDVGVDAGPGDTICPDLFFQESWAGFSSEQVNAGYADVRATAAGEGVGCTRELGADDVKVLIGGPRVGVPLRRP